MGVIPVGLHTHLGRLMLAFFERIAKGIADAGTKPAIQSLKQLLHRGLRGG
jgi:hypothetical protein